MSNIICIYTKFYPYSKYEVHVENEIKVMSQHFDTIYVFPKTKTDYIRETPKNVVVIDNLFEDLNYNPKYLSYAMFFLFLNLFDINLFRKIFRIRTELSFALIKSKEANKLSEKLQDLKLESAIHYSVWLDDWTFILSLLKLNKEIKSFHARAHGYDMYHFRRKENYLPFRDLILKHISTVSCVSKDGYNYLCNNYPHYKDKINLFHLGVFEFGLNPFSKDKLRFVTASSINEVKRNNLIVEALMDLKIEVEWVHFGEGPLQDSLMLLIQKLPNNINVKLMGRVSSYDLFNYYANNSINGFILVSSSEGGVPIAIQEAMSFGIPFIGTDAGGIKEIVNQENGVLLDVNFHPSELTVIIENFKNSFLNDAAKRIEIQNNWRTNFSADINYGNFINFLISHK